MSDQLTEREVAVVQEIVMGQLNVSREELKPAAAIMNDLGADSLDVAEISMKLEDAFSLTVPDDIIDEIQTISDLYEAVAKLLGRR